MRPAVAVTFVQLALVLWLATACQSSPAVPLRPSPAALLTATAAEATAVPAKPTRPVTLRVWIMPNGPDPAGAIQAEADAFGKQNPDVRILPQIIDWDAAYNRIQTALQGGDAPCITQLGTTWVPAFGAMGGLRPFTAADVKEMGGPEAFVKASWDASIFGQSQVAMPWVADVRALYYRSDVLERAGLKPDEAFKDVDSFVDALAAIKSRVPEVAPFVHPGKNDWNLWQNAAMFGWAYGGDLLTPDYAQAAFNSDRFVRGVAVLDSLYGRGLTSPHTLDLNSNQAEEEFGSGRAAMVISGAYIIANARADKDRGGWSSDAARQYVRVAEFPKGPGGQFTFVGGSALAVMRSCPDPDAAVRFVRYLLGSESQVRFALATGNLPALVQAQADPRFRDDPLYRVFVAASAKGRSSPPVAEWGPVEKTIQSAFSTLWDDVAVQGAQPIEAAQVKARLDAAAKAVNLLLAR